MSVFARFQNRLAKTGTLVPHPAEKITPPVDHSLQQSPTGTQQQQRDFPAYPILQTQKSSPDRTSQSQTRDQYECSEEWNSSAGSTARAGKSDTLSIPEHNRTSKPIFGDAAHAVAKQVQRRQSNTVQSQNRRAKTPLSSFYNVSSDEEDDDDDEEDEEVGGDDGATDENGDPNTIESAAAFERRSLRIRRSIDKAKAALPADFVDRIGVAPVISESTYRDQSATRTTGQRSGNTEMDDSTVQQTNGEFSCSEDEVDPTTQVPVTGDYANYPSESPTHKKSSSHRDSYNEADDPSTSTSSSTRRPSSYMSASGILWSSEPPQLMEELVPRFRSNPPGSTYLTKAIPQRSGCRCALCGHDSLLLFPVLDTTLALALWSSWSIPSKNHSRSSGGYERGGYGPGVTTVTEVHAQLAIFRQCRGWYEVLNENQQAIPHLTTVEQLRQAKPSTFLIRQDLKCLAAPPTLLVPPLKDTRPSHDGPPPVPFPSSVIAVATAPETLMNSVPENIPAGTLMHFITYLPHCPVKRGRKIKELGLILATKRVPGSPVRRTLSSEMSNTNTLPSRAYYIGLEDSSPAIFPPRFSISSVAGPENISGVHSMASILRKFRLPLSVRPIMGSEGSDLTERAPNGITNFSRSAAQGSNLFQCGLTAVQGLQFTAKHFLRLQSLCRGDIIIFSPVTSPERLFLITPSMLRDHVFQLGSASDPAYERLLEGHRLQSVNFLASAHPRDSLNYLVRHMQDVTREPRESYSTRKTSRRKADGMRAGSVDFGHPEMTQEEVYQAYDELDDIYFFIRHGYYPSKNRRPETPVRTNEQSSANRSVKNPGAVNPAGYEQPDLDSSTRKSDGAQAMKVSVPTAEQLLAASLKTPARNHSFQTRLSNGSGNAASAYRIQPKEYGI